MLTKNLRLSGLMAATLTISVSGCLETRVTTIKKPQQLEQRFVATSRVDMLVAVDASQLTIAQQAEVEDSVAAIIAELEGKGVDYHMGLVAPGAPIGSSIPGFGGANADWIALGMGSLTNLGANERFLQAGGSADLQNELLERISSGVQNEMGSKTRGKFEQGILPLLPIVLKAAEGGSNKRDLKSILRSVAPLVAQSAAQGELGGDYDEAMKAVLPLVQLAAGGGAQDQDFEAIVAALLPVAVNIGLQSSGAGPYAQAASILLPAVLELSDKAENGATFEELMGSMLPIILSSVGSSGSSDYIKYTALVTPLITSALKGSKNGKDKKALLNDLLPIALASVGKQGGSAEYTYLLSSVMPIALDMIQKGSMGEDPNAALSNVSQMGLATVLSAISEGKLKGINEGFLRDDALLSIVMIGEPTVNGKKQDPKALAESFLREAAGSKLGSKEKLVFDAILGGEQNICSSQTALTPNVYGEIAALTGGNVSNLCNNRTNIGDTLVSSVLSKLTEYSLDKPAKADTVQVFLDGLEVPQGTTNGWSLVKGKIVKLSGSYIPSASSEISVRYVAER